MAPTEEQAHLIAGASEAPPATSGGWARTKQWVNSHLAAVVVVVLFVVVAGTSQVEALMPYLT